MATDTTTTTRLSVNINSETESALKDLARSHGTTVTEIVRRAVGVYKFVNDETSKPGHKLQIVSDDQSEVIRLV